MAGSTVTTITFPRADSGRRGPTATKRGLKGAAGGLFVGPVLSVAANAGTLTSVTHATTKVGGGVEDSTGYRKSDNWVPDVNSTGGFAGGASTTITRPSSHAYGDTTHSAFRAAGVTGGSDIQDDSSGTYVATGVIDTTGRAEDTGKDRFGNTLATGLTAGFRKFTYTNFDGRRSLDGDGGRGLGNTGRGTSANGETITINTARATRHATAESSGEVAVVAATGKVSVAIHADDLPASSTANGTNGHAGAELMLWSRGTDTDEDRALAGICTFGTVSTDGADDTDALSGLAAATYAGYVRWRYYKSDGSIGYGPWSDRFTVVVS